MAEISRGFLPSDFSRLKVSRQEIPASTRMRARELSTTAVFPRLPLASTETETPISGSIHSSTVEMGVTFRLSWTSERRLEEFHLCHARGGRNSSVTSGRAETPQDE